MNKIQKKTIIHKNSCPLCSSKNIEYYVKDYWGNTYWKCQSCHLVFQRPIVQKNDDNYEWKNAVDPEGKKRDLTTERDFKIKNWYGDIVQYLKKRKPGKIIDIGCGLGFLLSSLPNTWDKYGYELSPFGQSFIKKHFTDITLIDDLNLALNEPSKKHKFSFDVVVCYHVIEHIEYPGFFMENMVKLLKPGGVLIIGAPNMGSLVARLFKGNFRLFNPDHVSMFNSKNMEWLLKQHNLKIFRKEYPFLKTEYFTLKNLLRMFQIKRISPPFYGAIMTMYAKNIVGNK